MRILYMIFGLLSVFAGFSIGVYTHVSAFGEIGFITIFAFAALAILILLVGLDLIWRLRSKSDNVDRLQYSSGVVLIFLSGLYTATIIYLLFVDYDYNILRILWIALQIVSVHFSVKASMYLLKKKTEILFNSYAQINIKIIACSVLSVVLLAFLLLTKNWGLSRVESVSDLFVRPFGLIGAVLIACIVDIVANILEKKQKNKSVYNP
ncbi:MAG: hypothetical protein A2231_06430 [Candidatus Firestonebacteria bacterium RIFOXYA2_FULL_40_8]|nr:MAG: hypothetical protein A2231_06430 [Candidatus Firestonebacteria bacterium RIFOXYA2_FULL_40_8]